MFDSRHQLVVRSHKPLRLLALYTALVLLTAVAIVATYFYGHYKAGRNFDEVVAQRDSLQARQSGIEQENTRLNERNVALQRESQVEKEGYSKVDERLKELQSEVLELKEEVAFYRSIVAPREAARGISVETFAIFRNGDAQSYRYKLVLTQVIKGAKKIKGDVTVTLLGTTDGKHTEYRLKDISGKKNEPLNFDFRYFQKFDGDIILPEGFSPSRVKLEINSKTANLEKQFNWASLLDS